MLVAYISKTLKNSFNFCSRNKYLNIFEGLAHADDQPLVGSNPCTYGPSYWCQNAANAAQCGITVSNSFIASYAR